MKKRSAISADLTSLLDVILIILFIIISRSYDSAEQAEAEKQQAYDELMSASEKFENEILSNNERLAQAENIISGYENFSDYAVIVSIAVVNKADNSRDIIISQDSKSDILSYNWENMLFGRNSLNAFLENIIKSDSEKPVFISFNYKNSDIYVKDYNMVSSVIDDFQAKNQNVYIIYNMED